MTPITRDPTAPPTGLNPSRGCPCPVHARPQLGAARAPGAGVCRQAEPRWRSAGGIRV